MVDNFDEWELKHRFRFVGRCEVSSFGENFVILTDKECCAVAQILRRSANGYEVITAYPFGAWRETVRSFGDAFRIVKSFFNSNSMKPVT